MALLTGVLQWPRCRSICHKTPHCGFLCGLCSGTAHGAAVGQLQTGTHRQEKVGLILRAVAWPLTGIEAGIKPPGRVSSGGGLRELPWWLASRWPQPALAPAQRWPCCLRPQGGAGWCQAASWDECGPVPLHPRPGLCNLSPGTCAWPAQRSWARGLQLGTRTAATQGDHAQRLRPSTTMAAAQPLQRQRLPQGQAWQSERWKCQQGCAGIKGRAAPRHSHAPRHAAGLCSSQHPLCWSEKDIN